MWKSEVMCGRAEEKFLPHSLQREKRLQILSGPGYEGEDQCDKDWLHVFWHEVTFRTKAIKFCVCGKAVETQLFQTG